MQQEFKQMTNEWNGNLCFRVSRNCACNVRTRHNEIKTWSHSKLEKSFPRPACLGKIDDDANYALQFCRAGRVKKIEGKTYAKKLSSQITNKSRTQHFQLFHFTETNNFIPSIEKIAKENTSDLAALRRNPISIYGSPQS